MPYCNVTTNVSIDEEKIRQIAPRLSSLLADQLGKPERWIMIHLEPNSNLCFGGTDVPTAHCKLKSIGLPEDDCPRLAQKLCRFLEDEMGVGKDRVYIEFADLPRQTTGWNGTTFATL